MQYHDGTKFTTDVVTIIFICICLPLTLWAIYALYSQVRKDHVAPIYVINLLISDLVQLCCYIVLVAPIQNQLLAIISGMLCFFAVMVSVSFMLCIALERYLVIAHPQWDCLRRSIKRSVGVCVLVWIVTLAFLLPVLFLGHLEVKRLIFGVVFLLPLPLLMFFLGGTLKALSASSISVPSDEKRRTVGILILLLLIFTLFFLPSVIMILVGLDLLHGTFMTVSVMLVKFSPFADLILCVFMRKGSTDTEGNKQYKQEEI